MKWRCNKLKHDLSVSQPAENMFHNTRTDHSTIRNSVRWPYNGLANAAVWKPAKVWFLLPETSKFLCLHSQWTQL